MRNEQFFSWLVGGKEGLSLQVVLSSACNLHCDYCLQSHVETQRWTLDKLNFVAKSLNDASELQGMCNNNLSFLGGEPLLRKRLLKEFLKQENFKSISYRIVTNGLYLDEEIIDLFYSKNNSFVGISLDEFHLDNERHLTKKQIQVISKHIRYITTKYPYRDAIYLCVNKNRINRLENTLRTFISLGCKNLMIASAFEPLWDLQDLHEVYLICKNLYNQYPDVAFTFSERDTIRKIENYKFIQATIQSDGTLKTTLFLMDDDRFTIGKIDFSGNAEILPYKHLYNTDPCRTCKQKNCALVTRDNDPYLPSSLYINGHRACKVIGNYITKINKMDAKDYRKQLFNCKGYT